MCNSPSWAPCGTRLRPGFLWLPSFCFYPQSFSSVQFSHSVVSDSLRPHESQHARPPCPSPTPGVYSNPCPSSRWCHPAISSSVVPFSSCPQSLPASGSFTISRLIAWGGQSLLRYNWHVTLYKFKVYKILIWYTYMLQNYAVGLPNTSIMSHNYQFFFMVRLFKICSLATFQYITVLLTITTTLYLRFPESVHLITLTNIYASPTPRTP